MFKLDLEKAEEPEIKLPTSYDIWIIEKAREFQTNIYFCFIDYIIAFVSITTNCRNLKQMEIIDHLTCLLRNLYAGQEATVRNDMKQQTGSKLSQGCIMSPSLFNFYAEDIMSNARLDEAQAGIKTAGRNINNLRYADDTTLWQTMKKN